MVKKVVKKAVKKVIKPIKNVTKPAKKVVKTNDLVDFSKYDNYKVKGDNILFLNPFTNRMIQVNKDTKKCPITGKNF